MNRASDPGQLQIGGQSTARRRGRPTPAEANEITGLILTAANDEFIAHSFEEASIEAVAARAGVKKDTIYKRYTDKRMLLRAVLKERVREWKVAAALVVNGTTLEDVLKSYAVALLSHATSPEGRIWIKHVESAWPGLDQLENRREAMGYGYAIRLISRQVRIWTTKDGSPARNPDLVATALMAILTGWTDATGLSARVSKQKVEHFAHSAVELLIGGRSAW